MNKKQDKSQTGDGEFTTNEDIIVSRSTTIQGTIQSARDVIFGDKYNYVTVVLQMAAYVPPAPLIQLRSDYLAHLQRQYRALDFKGIPQLETFARELLLEEVYVPLVARPEMPAGETWERRLAGRILHADALLDETGALLEKGMTFATPRRVEEAIREQARIVVIGDPGSGKSTLLKHLTLRLASESNAPLPILVPLNAYADAMMNRDCSLQEYLAEYFAGLAGGVTGLEPLFENAIAQGQAVILLDGLDEVQSQRGRLVAKVETFAHEATTKGNKLVVTSRVVGYRESPLDPKIWSLYTLLDFDRDAIEEFANKWCLAFEKSTLGDTPEARAAAERERAGLLGALDANPGVANLASNPLLLTILALIKRQGVSLPNRRVELYELYLKTLISVWNRARALDGRPVGAQLDYLETIAVLAPLALWLREENPTAGLVTEKRLIDWLTEFFKGEDWGYLQGDAVIHAQEFLDSVRRYSNLLLERGNGRYGFIHLTFEEALAARGLVQRGQLNLQNSLDVIQAHLTDPGWRETILLAVGVWGLVREQPRVAGEVVRSILKMDCTGVDAGKNVLLAGAALEDVGELGLGRAATNDVTNALLEAMRNRTLPPTVQRDAGFILGRIGWTPSDLDAFIEIPAGEFLYGSRMERKRIKSFAIAKYPVTNLQFKRFIEAEGYNRREFWSTNGWAWRTGKWESKASEVSKGRIESRSLEERNQPEYFHNVNYNNMLAPVVGVSWFESEAYCNWASKTQAQEVRLPTEEEWERAARSTDGRIYPWGDNFDRLRLNSRTFWVENGDFNRVQEIASPTIVGQFSEGNSLEGVCDMSGNVWEWTASDYDTTHKVVRGGAFFLDENAARCSYRFPYSSDAFHVAVGFRVVTAAG